MIDEIKIKRIGEINYNKFDNKMIIIKYENNKNMAVKFDDGYIVETEYKHFRNGTVKYPYDKTLYNVGYIGRGEYKISINGKHTKQYNTWANMLMRCYDPKYRGKHSTYENSTVCDEWHDFQNFAKWHDENYYEIKEQEMGLDKDILNKNNKIYSPTTCVFVSQNINKLFTKSDATRGKLPIGVSFKKDNQKYFAQMSKGNKNDFLGYYNDIEETFNVYKKHKEEYIKQIAEEYKNYIPKKLYDAMCNYIVEITD